MKRVLVTGASGFIGRHCLPLLAARGYEVHALSRRSEPAAAPATWHTFDILANQSASALVNAIRPTHLLHLAWTAEPGKFWTDPANAQWAGASERFVESFTHAGGGRVVAAGTCAEYDWNFALCSEDKTPLLPSTPYGTAKDRLNAALVELSRKDGFSFCWARVFWLYGPYEDPRRFVASAIISILQGKTFECRNPEQVRDFLYVEDVAQAFVSLLDSGLIGPVNIASGKGVALRSIVSGIADEIGRPELARFSEDHKTDPPKELVGSDSRLRSIGWQPTRSLRQGLAETVQWWRGRAA